MKKYGKVLIVGIVTFCASISAVNAKEKVTVKDLLSEAVEISPAAKDVYIVGDYAFTSSHPMTSQDIMLAARSIDVEGKTGKTNTGEVYPEMVVQHFNRTRTSSGYTEWSIVNPKIGTTDKKWTDNWGNKEISVHYIDYKLVNDVSADVEDELKKDVAELNDTASDYGFNDITYENHTLTFDISDLNKKLVEYIDSDIISMFQTIVNGEYGFTSITYTERTGVVTKSKTEVINPESLAGEMLLALSGKDNVRPSDLTYLDVANKSTTATVKYTDPKYGEKEVTYTLAFTYDTKTEKNKDLTEAAITLNKQAKNYGFKSISYNNETATFEIEDTTEKLFKFSTSGILGMFDKYIAGATKIEYTIGNTTVPIAPVDVSKKNTYAAQLLCLMANNGDNSKCTEPYTTAKDLTLGDVANKSATAKFTYTIGDKTEEISYTLKFNYDLETVKNEAIQADIEALNKKINANNEAFSSVAYDESTHTATFTIKNKEKTISDLGSGLVEFNKMFNEFVKDAESITYKVGEKTVTAEGNAVEIAKVLLCTMAGKENEECHMVNINLSDLSGKSASATVKYKVGEKSITYTVKFDTDPVAQASMLKFNSNNKAFKLN